jgi:hypothetical protein
VLCGRYPGVTWVVSDVAESQAVRGTQGGAWHMRAAGGRPFTAVGVVIVATTAVALALRVYYQSTLPQFLLGATEYDDGTYLGGSPSVLVVLSFA